METNNYDLSKPLSLQYLRDIYVESLREMYEKKFIPSHGQDDFWLLSQANKLELILRE